MLYILLTIIAIGVLLASKDGKVLLGGIWKTALIVGVLFVAYWVVIFVIAMLADAQTRETLKTIVAYIALAFLLGYWTIYFIYKTFKAYKFTRKTGIKNILNNLWHKDVRNVTITVAILVLIIIISYTFVAMIVIKGDTSSSPSSQPDTQTINDVQNIYQQSHMQAIAGVGDPAFSLFVSQDLESKCPLYKPDGATYRNCLNTLVESQQKAYKGTTAELATITNYCEQITQKYEPSLEAAELYLSCMTFKLSMN